MIKVSEISVVGFEPAIRGMRNSFNSWDESDSATCCMLDDCMTDDLEYAIGPKDLKLAAKLCRAGSSHAKFRRMMVVYADICAPLYWWKQFDTYKVGTVANSCSTMHKIEAKEFELNDFSTEHLIDKLQNVIEDDKEAFQIEMQYSYSVDAMKVIIDGLNHYRQLYLDTKDKKYWWQLIQLLPSSYNQTRTVMLSYEVLAKIYAERRHHKLDEWDKFCDEIRTLPYADPLIFQERNCSL